MARHHKVRAVSRLADHPQDLVGRVLWVTGAKGVAEDERSDLVAVTARLYEVGGSTGRHSPSWPRPPIKDCRPAASCHGGRARRNRQRSTAAGAGDDYKDDDGDTWHRRPTTPLRGSTVRPGRSTWQTAHWTSIPRVVSRWSAMALTPIPAGETMRDRSTAPPRHHPARSGTLSMRLARTVIGLGCHPDVWGRC